MKLRTGLLLSTAFVAGITAAPMAGLVARQFGLQLFPVAFAQDGTSANTYRLLNLFSDVFERVRADYVEPVKDQDLVENAINGMLTGLDPHSSYMNAKAYQAMQEQTTGEFGGLGMEVTADSGFIKVISPIDDTPASRAGIKAGDLIVTLDGESVQGLSLNEAVDKMHGPVNSKIKLVIKRIGVDKPIDVTLTREVIKIQVVKSHLEGDIGYIRITSFSEQTDPGVRKAFADLEAKSGNKLKGIVLDLRNNPGGLLDQAIAVSNDFIKDGEIVSTRARHPEDSQRWNAHDGDITGGLPMVVLMNGGSASASEIVGGALQDHRRAIIMGTRSFGKGSVQTVIPLPGSGGAMRLTTARYYTPSGRSIQGLGITPDIEVDATRDQSAQFPTEREADLKGAITNVGGVAASSLPPRTDLPPIAKDIPKLPPVNQPAYDPANFASDYQLQEALTVVRAMPSPVHAGP
jgi:carboxyl-terminal processing protease